MFTGATYNDEVNSASSSSSQIFAIFLFFRDICFVSRDRTSFKCRWEWIPTQAQWNHSSHESHCIIGQPSSPLRHQQ